MSIFKKIFYTLLSIIIFTFILSSIVKADTVKVTTETLNLREEPSTESDIVALISIGEECKLISEEGDWYEVKYGEYTGYISKEYAEKTGTTTENNPETNTTENNSDNNTNENTTTENNTTESTNTQTTTSTTILKGKVTEGTGIRIVPLISSSILENIKVGTEITVIEQINNWVYIQTSTVSGWIRSNFIEIEEAQNNKNNNTNNNADDNKDNNADDNSNSTDTTDFETRTMYTKDYVNIRSTPSTDSENIIMVVEENTALEVIGEEGDWYKVNTSEGEAYVSKDVLSTERTVTNRGSVDREKEETDKTTSTNSEEISTSSNSSSSSVKASEIVAYAKEFLGVPYVYGGASPSGFDCSGFTMYVFNHFGISMGHGAQMQSREGTAVKADKSSKSSLLNNLEVGDLVFFLDYETMDEIGHCGIYIGNGDFIHASSGSGYCVKINSLLPGEYYNTRYCAARRVI